MEVEENLRDFGSKVDDLIKGRDLTRPQARDMFLQVLKNDQPDLQQGAFLAAITAKGATPEELAGSWEAIYEVDTVKVRPDVEAPLVDNCGTGMDDIKTFNISTAASIVAACDRVYMAKHGARAITSRCGTVDMLEALGIDVECEPGLVKKSIERAGIGIFNGMSWKVHPQALYRILSKVRFGTVLNIAGSLANPARPDHGVRGVYSGDMVVPIARTMREIGYKRAMVVHGRDFEGLRGMDEISTLGETLVAELHSDGEIEEYIIGTSDLGLARGDEAKLLHRSDREVEAMRMLRLLSGMETGSRRDIVCLNAAPILYISGRVSDLRSGLEKAGDIIESGKPIDKLRDWIKEQSSSPEERLERFERMVDCAGAAH